MSITNETPFRMFQNFYQHSINKDYLFTFVKVECCAKTKTTVREVHKGICHQVKGVFGRQDMHGLPVELVQKVGLGRAVVKYQEQTSEAGATDLRLRWRAHETRIDGNRHEYRT